jgi:predicted nucleotidyltransferase
VAEVVDAADSKSVGRKAVLVRVRPGAPTIEHRVQTVQFDVATMSPNSTGVADEWIAALRAWADGERLIEALFLFGSRVKHEGRPDSDLDVAVLLLDRRGSERQLDWSDNSARWRAELEGRLPVMLDLHFYDPTSPGRIVEPQDAEHGREIFRRAPPA